VSVNYAKKTASLVGVPAPSAAAGPLRGSVDALTYEHYFGLSEKPFSLDADPRFIFDSPAHAATRKSLLAGIRRREGLQVLTGEIGTGKTTLCRGVLRDLGRTAFSSLVPDPFAAREDLLKMLLVDFGVVGTDELTAGLRGASRTELGYLLGDFLNSLSPDAFAVVIIDEAQNLSLPLIEETRILFDTFGAKGRLQIVFVGQPELQGKLKLPEMRQVDQRVCGYHRLVPMNGEAVAGYINHRLHVAGYSLERVLFPAAVVDALQKRSGGVPRLINRLCDRALHLACERNAERVDQEILAAALNDIGAITLSPTWDSIVFGDTTKPIAAPRRPANSATVAPAPGARPTTPLTLPADRGLSDFQNELDAQKEIDSQKEIDPLDGNSAANVIDSPKDSESEKRFESPKEHDFQQEINDWVEHELAPAFRTPPRTLAEPASRRSSASPAQKRDATRVTTDWPRHVRSETYMQKMLRMWVKRAVIVAGVLIAGNIAIAVASLVVGSLSLPILPSVPEAPPKELPAIVAVAPASDGTVVADATEAADLTVTRTY
jgi:type II secretory pathway predicted ATPase ExeA